MSPPQYSSVNSRPAVSEEKSIKAEANGDSSLALTKPYDDNAQSSLLDPFIPQQSWLYLQFFIPLLIVFIFPPVFAVFVYAHGQVAAPRWVSNFTLANPRITPQIVAIFASALTATTRWALGGAAALLARKRLLTPRPVFEIDMFFSLRNISVVWDWKHRRRVTILTWLLVAVCGLLTSGFFTLFNPIPMRIATTRLSNFQEVDLYASSGICTQWLKSIEDTRSLDITSRVDTPDVTNLARVMAMQYFASGGPSKGHPSGIYVNSYRGLEYMRVWGSTAGALMSGTSSGDTLDFPALPLWNPTYLGYRLDLQGFWLDASCSYDNTTALNVTWGNIVNHDQVIYSSACPGSSTFEDGRTTLDQNMGRLCTLGDGTLAVLFRNRYDHNKWDYLKCEISPRIGDARATLDADLLVFTFSKGSTTTTTLPPSSLANLLMEEIIGTIISRLTASKEVEEELMEVIKLHTGYIPSYSGRLGADWLDLVALVLQGAFELQASISRKWMTQVAKYSPENIPPECLRQVKVEADERVVGWEVKLTTLVGLLPLLVVCIIAFAMITLAVIAKGRLTLFDPMSPVSLIVATSAGEVVFPKQALGASIGDPLDEKVLMTKVSYGQDGQVWGLRSFVE